MSSLLFLLPLLVLRCHSAMANGNQHQRGVYVSINGIAIENDGYVDFDSMIKNGTSVSLKCHTNKTDCCHSDVHYWGERLGDWYYPNRTVVESYTRSTFYSISEFFARRRSHSTVHLYISGTPPLDKFLAPPERGRFYCSVPDANNVIETVYINILDIGAVTVSSFIPSDCEQPFSLVCSVDISDIHQAVGNVPTPNFQWFFGPNNASLPSGLKIVSNAISSGHINTYTSTLQFSSLGQPHAGLYTCRLGGNARLAANMRIIVNSSSTTAAHTSTHDASSQVNFIIIGLSSSLAFVVFISTIIITILACIIKRMYKKSKDFIIRENTSNLELDNEYQKLTET